MTRPVLYLIATAAGPAQHVDAGIRAAQAAGWDTCLFLTPTAATWWADSMAELESLTGHPVRHRYTLPGQSGGLPKADAMHVAPLTTTSACKWAAGITDTVALGVPAEAVHLGVPVVAAPFWSTALGAQPAVGRAVETLRGQGVRVVFTEGEPHAPKQGDAAGFGWDQALGEVRRVLGAVVG
ncbi:flavoprotein [Streptomyces albidoflavus]|uniref:flavoprotein n=1 Tax=Streptomyces albidoflavus TaxID=1886 RepID=UPI00101E46CE|nr:flavoprotein [Streptomyces albidoflavus]RZD81014.1 flavoprotein [Streptomyces albidoflavus]RZD98584.1 flavoprotein [Streptomyces albidoflavus]